mgnify:CR=1 FL=1
MFSVNTLMCAHCARHDTVRASGLFRTMTEASVQTAANTWLPLIQEFARRGSADQIEGLFKLQRKHGGQVQEAEYALLVQAFAHALKRSRDHQQQQTLLEGANRVLTTMQAANMPRTDAYGYLIKALSVSGQAERAEALISELIEHGLEPTADMFNSLIYHCAHTKDMLRWVVSEWGL